MNRNILLKKVLRPKENPVMQNITIGNRIPKDYFVTKGKGESDITIHAGSYHLALKAAGIEMCNIMTYSSILPSIAREVKKHRDLVHGSVMETIMAAANAEKGERATAGIIYGWLHDKKSHEKYGGLVCEYNGDLPEKEARSQLQASLVELYENGFSESYSLKNIRLYSNSFKPEKKFGTAIVALCFVNYMVPVLSNS